MLSTIMSGIFFGVVSELSAFTLQLWQYRQLRYPVINIVLLFGVVMGLLASQIQHSGFLPVVLIAFAIGYIYEILNFRLLHWWDFPNTKFLVFTGQQGCSISVALLWAITPVAIIGIEKYILQL